MANARKGWITKLEEVKKLLQSKFSDLEMHNVQEKMSAIAHYHYNRKDAMILG